MRAAVWEQKEVVHVGGNVPVNTVCLLAGCVDVGIVDNVQCRGAQHHERRQVVHDKKVLSDIDPQPPQRVTHLIHKMKRKRRRKARSVMTELYIHPNGVHLAIQRWVDVWLHRQALHNTPFPHVEVSSVLSPEGRATVPLIGWLRDEVHYCTQTGGG